MIKNVHEYIESLMKTDQDLMGEKVTPAFANSRANLAGKVAKYYKLQLEYAKAHGTAPKISFLEAEM